LGNLNVWRDFIHVNDVVEILIKVRNIKGLEIFNAGSGNATHLLNLAIKLGIKPNMYDNSNVRPNEIIKTQADISKISSLNFKLKYPKLIFVNEDIRLS